jgi:hypothetical protein
VFKLGWNKTGIRECFLIYLSFFQVNVLHKLIHNVIVMLVACLNACFVFAFACFIFEKSASFGMSNTSQHAKYAEARQVRQIQKQRFQKHVLHCGITKTTTMGTSKNKLFSSTLNT